MLKAAFEGRLVPQDPSDDSASVLLDRIRAERAAAPKRLVGRGERREGPSHPPGTVDRVPGRGASGRCRFISVRVEVQPGVLEWARARSGIGDETWLTRFPRYEAWLEGETAPTLKQLEDFARRTHTSLGFLFLDEPPVESVPIPDFRTIGSRPVGVGVGQAVSADLLDVNHQLLNGEPPLDFVGSARVSDPVEAIA